MFATVRALVAAIVGTEGADRIEGTDNADTIDGLGGNDILTGGAGNDTIDGGRGHDRMIGGAGDDTYIVDTTNDVIVEGGSGGFDTVLAATQVYILPTYVEKLVFTTGGSHIGYGNAGANVLVGPPSGNAILNGLAGNDTLDDGGARASMNGGEGNDTYIVSNTHDSVSEAKDHGIDTVQSSISFALPVNVETLILTGGHASSGTGNAMDNTIIGNAAANTIDGGRGADLLTGGGGADVFVFKTMGKPDPSFDTITDFGSDDQLRLSLHTFGALGHTGGLDADAFWAANGARSAHDPSDRIVYDTHTGALYYDADGKGGAAAVEFALLKGHPAIGLDAFHIIT